MKDRILGKIESKKKEVSIFKVREHKAAQSVHSRALREMLANGGGADAIEKHIAFEAAPVITGVKPSALINIRLHAGQGAAQFAKASAFVHGLGLQMAVLYAKRRRVSVLVYDEKLLQAHIRQPHALELLEGLGYDTETDTAGMLKRLAWRRRGEYPHEIGIFLGYPARDVQAFIESCGRDCLLCGYWKVYHDAEGAKRTFLEIDRAKNRMGALLVNNVPPHMAACML